MSRVIQNVASVRFEINARQASAAMEALRGKADELNSHIATVEKQIADLGNVAPDHQGLLSYRQQLKELKSDLNDVNKTIKDYTRGVKAADELLKAAEVGNMESLSMKAIKAGQNGLKKRIENIQPDTLNAEELKAYRIIKQVIEEADGVVNKFKTDAAGVVQTLRDGGTVSERAMKQARDGVKSLMESYEEGSKENREFAEQYEFLAAKVIEFGEAQRRAAGEIVTVNDAMRKANTIRKESAETASAIAEFERDAYAKLKKSAEEDAQASKQKIDNIKGEIAATKESIESKKKELATVDEQITKSNELKEAIKQGAELRRELAKAQDEVRSKRGDEITEKGEWLKLNDEVVSATVKVEELQEKLQALGEKKVTPKVDTSEIERLKKELEETHGKIELLREKTKKASLVEKQLREAEEQYENAKQNKSGLRNDEQIKQEIINRTKKFYAEQMGNPLRQESINVMQQMQVSDLLKEGYSGKLRDYDIFSDLESEWKVAHSVVDDTKRRVDELRQKHANLTKQIEELKKVEQEEKQLTEKLSEAERNATQSTNELTEAQNRYNDAVEKRKAAEQKLQEVEGRTYEESPRIKQLKEEITKIEELIAVSDKYRKQFVKMSDETFDKGFERFEAKESARKNIWDAQKYLEEAYNDKLLKAPLAHMEELPDNPAYKAAAKRVADGIMQNAQENVRRVIFDEIKNGSWSPEQMGELLESMRGQMYRAGNSELGLKDNPEYQAYKYIVAQMEKYLEVARQVQDERKKMAGSDLFLEAAQRKTDSDKDIYPESLSRQKESRGLEELTEWRKWDKKKDEDSITAHAKLSIAHDEERKALEELNQAKKESTASTQEANQADEERLKIEQELEQAQTALTQAKEKADAQNQKVEAANQALLNAEEKQKKIQEELNNLVGGRDFDKEEEKLSETIEKHEELTEAIGAEEKKQQELTETLTKEQQVMEEKNAAAKSYADQETEAAIQLAQAQNQSQEGYESALQVLEKVHKKTNEGTGEYNEQAEAIDKLKEKLGQMKGELMSLEEAKKLAGQAGTDGFFATPQMMNQAVQAIERRRAAIIKTIRTQQDAGKETKREEEELKQLDKVLKDLKFEQDNFNMSHKKMTDILKEPKSATDLDELRGAIKRADGELHRMQNSLGENSKEYKDFEKQVKAAKLELKEMEGQAKANASAWSQAISRLKSYVGVYLSFNIALQKVTATMGDLMVLSDKMGEVRKTTGFTADEVGRLSDNLAKLDTRTSLANLMSVSAKAGQLGLKTQEDVMGFTEAANKLMVALPEMGEEAATQMMKVAIATGEVKKIQKEMDEGITEGSSATAIALERIGSTINTLRANSAAAAPQITDFVKRVGAVGAQSNISIDQVAALGSTVDALGMRVEMSATALSRMIPAIKRNAFEVAKAIGMAPNALRQMFDEAGGGMNAMLAIFQHIKDAGMNADDIEAMMGMGGMTDIMKDLNQQGARAGIVFAGLSQNVDELRRQLGIARNAYEENIAIEEEYDKMNETTAAKWERLKNQIEEVFVSNSNQGFLGDIIDALRNIVDLLTGPLSTAVASVGAAFAAIKLGITSIPAQIGGFFDYLKESAMKAGEELQKAANATGDIAKAAEGIEGAGDAVSGISDALGDAQEAGEQAGEAMETATGAIEGMTGATKVSIFSVQGLKTAWKGLDTTMKANIIVAVIALLYTLGKALYNALTETSKYSKAVADANAMIQIAIDRFEGYWEKLQETKVALDNARKSTEGLKEDSEELTKATIDLTNADNDHKAAIADINSIYGKYLGFMLTEANYANLNAAAHDKVAAAIRREMLAKQQQAAIDQVTQENTENLKDGLAKLTEELREDGRLNSQESAKAKNAVQKFMRENIKFDVNSQKYTISEAAGKELGIKGGEYDQWMTQRISAMWLNKYLENTFHLDAKSRADITGVTFENGSYKVASSNFDRAFLRDYAKSYLDNMQQVAEVQDVFAGDLGDAQKEDREATKELVEKLKKQADTAKAKIVNKSTSEKERNAAYEDLANALEGLDGSIDQLNPVENKTLIDAVKKQADDISKSVDKDKLLRARTNARSIFARATGGTEGYTPETPLDSEKNPWGSKQPAESTDWTKMTAEQLVQRRKQMKEFVNSIQTDTDVKAVLEEDAALKRAIEKGMSSDMRTVIEWYNTERLKIQDELHARHLTNTGDWLDPKKAAKRAKKVVLDEMKYYMDELDAYYTERKAKIQEAQNDEEISEAEARNRTLANEAEWRQRRAELQQLYAKKSEKVAKEEQDAIFDILSDRTGESIGYIQKDIAQTVKFIEAVGSKNKAAMDRIFGDLDKDIETDFLRQRNAIGKHMKAIQDIIDKENPFSGIVENLRKNLGTMDVLLTDIKDEEERTVDKEIERTMFIMEQSTKGYSLTWEEMMREMAERGWQAWADAINSDTALQTGLMHQVTKVYEAVQDAIKKEAAELKKQADIMWSNILLPGGDGRTTVKDAFEQTIGALGVQEGKVSRANSLIGAGQASERVADKLAIQQMKVQLAMQQYQYNLMRKQGQEKIEMLRKEAQLQEELGEMEKARALRMQADNAEQAKNLAIRKEQNDLLKQQEDIIAKTEESQNRLYSELREWADLLTSGIQSVMEANAAGSEEYYNELAKLNLTGKGGPGAGTYVIIDNAGTSDATAHYEYLDERQALEREREIERENAVAEAWEKMWDDLNMKLSETITDQLNAMLQNQSIDANTQATLQNTEALMGLNETVRSDGFRLQVSGFKNNEANGAGQTGANAGSADDIQEWKDALGDNPMDLWMQQSNLATQNMIDNNKKIQQSTQTMFAKMTLAANMYGAAYQAMSNDNLSMTQKFEMMALQAVGNYAIGALTTEMASASAKAATDSPGVLGTLWKQLGWAAAPVFAIFTGLLGGLMGLATSKVGKAKSTIAQATGTSVGAGRLATGMLTYAEGNVNEFTDPKSLTPGRSYNVDAADGNTYRARYMGANPKTHITNGPEFHLVGEKGREAIIDAHTTRQLQMDDNGIWQSIQTLYNGGRLSHSSMRRRGRGVRAFADGNLEDFDDMIDGGSAENTGLGGIGMEQMAAFQASLDRNSAIMERLAEDGIEAFVSPYGKRGIVNGYDTYKKEAKRHGEKHL